MLPLRIVPDNPKIPVVRWRVFTLPFSAAISVLTVVLLLTVGLHFGVDFIGGTLIEVQAKSGRADVAAVRQIARSLEAGEVEVQEFGTQGGVSLRIPLQTGGEQAQTAMLDRARRALQADYEIRRVETVGPRASSDLVRSGVIGVVLSVLAVLAYLWFRFELQLALAAIVGTVHDIVLTLGFFAITRDEFNMTSIAAILTIIGYSLNETVVVFDRTRELLRKYKSMPIEELLDLSVNSTLSRTAMTATTTAIALIALVVFGGEAIRSFAIVMLFGVVLCTYSAIFVSTPSLIYIGLKLGTRAAQRGGTPAKARP